MNQFVLFCNAPNMIACVDDSVQDYRLCSIDVNDGVSLLTVPPLSEPNAKL